MGADRDYLRAVVRDVHEVADALHDVERSMLDHLIDTEPDPVPDPVRQLEHSHTAWPFASLIMPNLSVLARALAFVVGREGETMFDDEDRGRLHTLFGMAQSEIERRQG